MPEVPNIYEISKSVYVNEVGNCSSSSLAQALLYKLMPFYKALISSVPDPFPQFLDG